MAADSGYRRPFALTCARSSCGMYAIDDSNYCVLHQPRFHPDDVLRPGKVDWRRLDPCFEPSRVQHLAGWPPRVRIVLRDIDGRNAGWETELLLKGIAFPPPPPGRIVRTPGFWATIGRGFREMFG